MAEVQYYQQNFQQELLMHQDLILLILESLGTYNKIMNGRGISHPFIILNTINFSQIDNQ